jgi:transcriptional regulator with XRE-family HTH domain
MGYKRFSDQIREAVRRSGRTRYDICKEMNISQAVLSRFMAGKSGLQMDTLDRLAEALGLVVSVQTPNKGTKAK